MSNFEEGFSDWEAWEKHARQTTGLKGKMIPKIVRKPSAGGGIEEVVVFEAREHTILQHIPQRFRELFYRDYQIESVYEKMVGLLEQLVRTRIHGPQKDLIRLQSRVGLCKNKLEQHLRTPKMSFAESVAAKWGKIVQRDSIRRVESMISRLNALQEALSTVLKGPVKNVEIVTAIHELIMKIGKMEELFQIEDAEFEAIKKRAADLSCDQLTGTLVSLRAILARFEKMVQEKIAAEKAQLDSAVSKHLEVVDQLTKEARKAGLKGNLDVTGIQRLRNLLEGVHQAEGFQEALGHFKAGFQEIVARNTKRMQELQRELAAQRENEASKTENKSK